MAFERVALGELIRLKRGYDLPAGVRRAGAFPVVSSRGVIGSHDVARVPGPGVVTGRTGTLGGVYFVEGPFWPLNTTLFVEDFKGNDPRFVSYLLRTIDFVRHNDKAAIPGVNRADLHAVEVPRPPLRRQKEIAAVLATLDRRIDVLQRMDRNLAATTAALFQLVEPGPHRRIDALCASIGNGATPARQAPALWRNGRIPWFTSGELADGPLGAARERIHENAVRAGACRVWPAGTVLVAMYAAPTVGRLGVLTEPASCNQACCALQAHAEYGAWFLFHALLATRARLQRLAVGAAQQNINQKTVRAHEIATPPAGAARAFHRRVARLHGLRRVHAREAALLAAMRDVMLRDLLAA